MFIPLHAYFKSWCSGLGTLQIIITQKCPRTHDNDDTKTQNCEQKIFMFVW